MGDMLMVIAGNLNYIIPNLLQALLTLNSIACGLFPLIDEIVGRVALTH